MAWTTPITTSLGAAVAASDFSGRTIACRQHILADTICIMTPFVKAGARVRVAPCNADSTDDRAVAHQEPGVLVAAQEAAGERVVRGVEDPGPVESPGHRRASAPWSAKTRSRSAATV